MPFDGNGIYNPISPPNFPAVAGTTITVTQYNLEILDIAGALSNCLTRDGQGAPLGNIGWNGFKLINLAPGTNPADAVNKVQMDTAIAVAIAADSLDSVGFVTGFRNLFGAQTGLTTATSVFDSVRLRTVAGTVKTVLGGTVNLDLSLANQAGGRDQAGSFTNQWAHKYAIWGSGPGLNCIASASASAPTLPTGYTHFAYMCPIRVGSPANNLVAYFLRGGEICYQGTNAQITPSTAINGSSTYPFTNYAVFIPPNASTYRVRINLVGTSTGGGAWAGSIQVAASGTSLDQWALRGIVPANTSQLDYFWLTLPYTSVAPVLNTFADAAWTANNMLVQALGYTFCNGAS